MQPYQHQVNKSEVELSVFHLVLIRILLILMWNVITVCGWHRAWFCYCSHSFTLPGSLQEKDEKVKTVEVLLETSLIQVANKEEELKVNGFDLHVASMDAHAVV